ncbi:gastrin-releasing peptide [Lampris incognitus]|uniref:gastrin-releasing peptide n=1 Tax=Lampris incognitus TaxID=2546036 RepID=UPI0024B4B0FA|nr:gastrin-releasing peptide [Lampris incognitus]
MGEVCVCSSWTFRPVLPVVVVIVALLSCTARCTESPAAAGSLYPRGNHWAVGHLMGKKSIEGLPGVQDNKHDSDYSSPSERGGRLPAGLEHPMKSAETFLRALVHPEQKRQMLLAADRLFFSQGQAERGGKRQLLRRDVRCQLALNDNGCS